MRLFMDNPRDCFSSSPVALPAFIPLKNVEKSPGQALETSILCYSLAWQGMSDPSFTIRSFTREKYIRLGHTCSAAFHSSLARIPTALLRYELYFLTCASVAERPRPSTALDQLLDPLRILRYKLQVPCFLHGCTGRTLTRLGRYFIDSLDLILMILMTLMTLHVQMYFNRSTYHQRHFCRVKSCGPAVLLFIYY